MGHRGGPLVIRTGHRMWDGHREPDVASQEPISGPQKRKPVGSRGYQPVSLLFLRPFAAKMRSRCETGGDQTCYCTCPLRSRPTQFFGPSAGMDDRRPVVGISTHIPIIGCPRLVAIENRSDADGMFANSDNLIHHSFTNFLYEKRSVRWTICWWRFRLNAAIKIAKERMWD